MATLILLSTAAPISTPTPSDADSEQRAAFDFGTHAAYNE
jgi:hypothetical protein